MKKFKNVIVALLVLIMGTLSGCAAFQKFDASGYTKACLDATYKGEFDEYIKLTKQTKEDAEKTYNQNLELATQQLTAGGVSEELSEKYMHKNYTVEVEIEPAQVFEGVLEATQAEVETLVTAQAESGTIPSQDEIIEQTFQILYDKVSANMKNITYGEKQVIEISVTKDSNNVYSISQEDYLKLDAAMYDKNNLSL